MEKRFSFVDIVILGTLVLKRLFKPADCSVKVAAKKWLRIERAEIDVN